jgi:hypothetical protein
MVNDLGTLLVLRLGMITQMSMKTLLGQFSSFIRRQWFLIIMVATITLIVVLFEVL